MKKWVMLAIAAFALAGCSQGNNQAGQSKDSSQTTVSTAQSSTTVTEATTDPSPEVATENTSTSESETNSNPSSAPVESSTSGKSSSKTPESTATSSSKATSETSSSASGDNQTADALAQLKEKFANVSLPTTFPRDESLHLNIAETGDENKMSALFYNLEQALVLDSQKLNGETPFAYFAKTTYETSGKAKEAVNYNYDDGGRKVDLGHDIAGYTQGAAGSTYLSWKEGNWALTVRGNNAEGQDTVAAAKEIVDYLETAFLPVPQAVGQIVIDLAAGGNYDANTVTWQADTVVYQVSHQEPLAALEMAVSVAD